MIFKKTLVASMIIISLSGCTNGNNNSSNNFGAAQPVVNERYIKENPEIVELKRKQKAEAERLRLEQEMAQLEAKTKAEKLQLEKENAEIAAAAATQRRIAAEETARLRDLNKKERVKREGEETRLYAIAKQEERRAQGQRARDMYQAKAPTYFLFPGETYSAAISRWLRSEGIVNIAWADDPNLLDALERTYPADGEVYKVKAYIHDAIDDLKNNVTELNKAELTVTLQRNQKTAAVHAWPNRRIKVANVQGENLRLAVKNLVKDYGWNWNDESDQTQVNSQRSWRPAFDLPFTGSYPIVTPDDDIGLALETVLTAYPVKASRLDSTRQIFIIEDK